jgi:hypothetical protein
MPDLTSMSDHELLREWGDMQSRAASLLPLTEPPRHTPDQQRCERVKSELQRRGWVYVQNTPDYWNPPTR